MHRKTYATMSNITCGLGGNGTIIDCGTTAKPVEDIDGYAIPLTGLSNGTFYTIHVPALICICLSFICAVLVISYSFYSQKFSTFFNWTKSERFVVYMALCDGLFNMSHFCDHFHILVTKALPRPKSLCVFYAFILTEFISAQNLMVNIVAINIFVLIYCRKQLDFGRYDYRLLVYIFGVPGLGATIAAALGQFGPNGSFCYFDGIKGKWSNIFFTTVPFMLVMVVNTVFYTISWCKIYKETQEIKNSLGKSSRALRASHDAAKTMSLFVLAFFVQWWAFTMFGIWQLIENAPQLLFHFITTMSNVGGILNGFVFIVILKRRQKKMNSSNKATDSKESGRKTTSTHVASAVHSAEAASAHAHSIELESMHIHATDIASTSAST